MTSITIPRTEPAGLPAAVLLTLSLTTCLLLGNIYYPQAVLSTMAADLGFSAERSGTIITAGQIGYAAGILLLVPLADKIANRRLIVTLTTLAAASMALASVSTGRAMFLCFAFLTGFFTSAVQIAVPFAASLADLSHRGRVLGFVCGGLVTGIVLSRSVASFLGDLIGWRGLYLGAAAVLALLAIVQLRALPLVAPAGKDESVGRILRSLPGILVRTKGLGPCLVISFLPLVVSAVFWSAAPQALAQTFGFTRGEIALLMLVGAVAIPAVIGVGGLLDRGHGALLTRGLTGLGVLAFAALALLPGNLAPFVLAIAVTDTTLIVVGAAVQRILFSLNPRQTGRLNALSVTFNFTGGALGSFAGPWILHNAGFPAVAVTAGALMLFCLAAAALVMRRGD